MLLLHSIHLPERKKHNFILSRIGYAHVEVKTFVIRVTLHRESENPLKSNTAKMDIDRINAVKHLLTLFFLNSLFYKINKLPNMAFHWLFQFFMPQFFNRRKISTV